VTFVVPSWFVAFPVWNATDLIVPSTPMIEPVPDVRTVLAFEVKRILLVLVVPVTVHVPSTVPVEATVIFVPTG
jgi:hypothetical protein